MKKSRRIREYLKNANFDSEKYYSVEEAVSIMADYASKSSVKFQESIDAHVLLGIDPTKGDQVIKSSVILPHGTGKKIKVIVFAEGDDIQKALDAGATHAGGDDLIEKVKDGFMDFDKCIATPSMMKKLTPLGRVLGPRNLMPNPKLGTVTQDVANVTQSFLSGRVEYRTAKDSVVRTSIGRINFEKNKIIDNIKALMLSIKNAKPANIKGAYIIKLNLAGTMSGFSVKIHASFL